MRRQFLLLFVFPILLLFSSVALAWSDAGHKVVALIAWSKLTPELRTAVIALIEQHPEFAKHFAEPMKAELGESPSAEERQRWLFAQASIWPDLVRPPLDGSPNPNQKYHHSSWHYLDLPVFADAEAEQKLGAEMPVMHWTWKPGYPDFIEQKLTASQVIDKAKQTVPDVQHEMNTDRAVMLCWLFHVTGDLHQPCHCSSLFAVKQFPKGDRGANSILLKYTTAPNMHSFWDELLGAKVSAAEAQARAVSIEGDAVVMQKAETSSSEVDPHEWIKEGSALAKAKVYTPEIIAEVLKTMPHTYDKNNIRYEAVGPLELTPEQMKIYTDNAHAVARQQVAIGGLRLAKLIETLMK